MVSFFFSEIIGHQLLAVVVITKWLRAHARMIKIYYIAPPAQIKLLHCAPCKLGTGSISGVLSSCDLLSPTALLVQTLRACLFGTDSIGIDTLLGMYTESRTSPQYRDLNNKG